MILIGDCTEQLRGIQEGSVRCCITSPPYWGLRDYGVDGQIGMEGSPDAYARGLVAVFREVRRVLAKDGTVWLNLGDSYSSGGRKTQTVDSKRAGPRTRTADADAASGKHAALNGTAVRPGVVDGLAGKQLIGIPWRVAFALQADGWILRCDIVWSKPNPMPESITDRPTRSHEYLFLLSRSPSYYYNAEAIREPLAPSSILRYELARSRNALVDPSKYKTGVGRATGRPASVDGQVMEPKYRYNSADGTRLSNQQADGNRVWSDPAAIERGFLGRNRRSVWTIPTRPFSGAHFATFPPALVEPCIKAGSEPGDVVLDPFFGAGTTGLVASRLARRWIGIELNADYARIAEDRIRDDAPLLYDVYAQW